MKLRNKYNIIVLVSLLSLQSCGVFNKVFKSSNKKKENTEVVVNKEEVKTIEDKSVITIREKKDTIIYTKPSSGFQLTPVPDLSQIKDLIVLDNNLVQVRQTYDTLQNILRTDVNVKSQPVIVNIDKVTNINKDVREEVKSKSDSINKKDSVIKETIKTKEPKNIFWYAILGIGGLATLYFISRYIISKKA